MSSAFDADHPAFLVMDEDYDAWIRQLDRLSPGFGEPEREAFRRNRFRRDWMKPGARFDIARFIERGFPWAVPATAAEWRFLLSAWMTQCPPSRLPSVNSDRRLGALRFASMELNAEMLQSIRALDEDLYARFSLDLWAALSERCAFEDRFHYHPGGCGQRQARKSVEIECFDQFLQTWPVQDDPLLASIANETRAWWDAWSRDVRERRG